MYASTASAAEIHCSRPLSSNQKTSTIHVTKLQFLISSCAQLLPDLISCKPNICNVGCWVLLLGVFEFSIVFVFVFNFDDGKLQQSAAAAAAASAIGSSSISNRQQQQQMKRRGSFPCDEANVGFCC
jgi:hypothetical protein